MARKFLVVLMTIIMLISIMGISVKNSVLASEDSVEVLYPLNNARISTKEDLTMTFWVRNSKETSYKWGYSFVTSAAIFYTYSTGWSYKTPLQQITIPACRIQEAYNIYGENIHLYIYEIDPHGYTIGFYKLINFKASPGPVKKEVRFVGNDTSDKHLPLTIKKDPNDPLTPYIITLENGHKIYANFSGVVNVVVNWKPTTAYLISIDDQTGIETYRLSGSGKTFTFDHKSSLSYGELSLVDSWGTKGIPPNTIWIDETPAGYVE